MTDLIYETETHEIIGACMEVHKTLRHGFKEVVNFGRSKLEFKRLFF